MKKDTETLPKTLAGVVCEQRVRCGKASCRCSRGHLHGPYFYRFWRHQGRLRKVYVPRAAVERVRAECAARRDIRAELAVSWRVWRELLAQIRNVEAL